MKNTHLFLLLTLFLFGIKATEAVQNIPDIKTSMVFQPNEIQSDTVKQLIFFSNDGCGKCSQAKNYFDEHHMPYKKLAIKQNRALMYEYVNKKPGGASKGVGYPVLIYCDSIYFSIKNLNATLKKIEHMMKNDGLIKGSNN